MSNRICLYSPPFSNISSYRDMIDCACDLGINAVECFSMFEFCEPDISMAEDIKKYSVEKGVSFPCFSVFCDISKTEYSSLLKRLKAYTDISAVLGSPYIHHTIVGEAYSPESVVPMGKELFETGINLVREVYDYAESIGVKAVYEEQGYIFNGCNGFEHFLDTVDRDIAVVGDFGNIYQSDGTALDFVKQNINRICHVHVKDVSVLDFNKDGKLLVKIDWKKTGHLTPNIKLREMTLDDLRLLLTCVRG